jgi:hypothetical protein
MHNLVYQPDVASTAIADLCKPPPVQTRKRSRTSAFKTAQEHTERLQAAQAYFRQNTDSEPNPVTKHTRERMRPSMQRPAQCVLSKLGDGWQAALHTPVLDLVTFARAVFLDVQHVPRTQLTALYHLQAAARWATDSSVASTWFEQLQQWEMLLPPVLRSLENDNGKYHMLRRMACTHVKPQGTYTVQADSVIRLLPEICEVQEADEENEEEMRYTHTPQTDDLLHKLPKQVVFLPGATFVRNLLEENERRFLQELVKKRRKPMQSAVIQIRVGGWVNNFDMGPDFLEAAHAAGHDYETEDTDADSADSTDDDSDYNVFSDADTKTEDEAMQDTKSNEDEEDRPQLPVHLDEHATSHVAQQLALAARVTSALTASLGIDTCVICHTDTCNSMLSCGHSFCLPCIHSWLTFNYNCPVCMRACSGQAPIYVPIGNLVAPPPEFCKDDAWCVALWQRAVCTSSAERLTSLAFWLTSSLYMAQHAAEPHGVLVVVSTCTQARKVCEAAAHAAAISADDCMLPALQLKSAKSKAAFKENKCHGVVKYDHVMGGGLNITGPLRTVLLLSVFTSAEQDALATRLYTPGHVLKMHTCVYSVESTPLSS